VAVLDSVADGPIPFVGHSKGGAILTSLVEAAPHRATRLANLDGLPSRRAHPDVADHERTRLLAEEVTGWLDHRRRAATAERKPGTIDELARRRLRMNQRLPLVWLRYLVPIGGRRDADGWRWKIDPARRFGGFAPWRPDWALERLPGLPVPLLGIIGLVAEDMGWGTTTESLVPYLPPGARLEPFSDSGHFVHIEQPRRVADLVLDFLGQPR
jgi:pimeloyl-ACP methyl ester carboxylesterase